MEISANFKRRYSEYDEVIQMHKKRRLDTDEEIVRHELLRVWTKILNRYAQPGAHIPATGLVRKELIDIGVKAAVKAVVAEHWFVRPWMIQDEIQRKVERGLDERFDLERFIEDVKIAQHDPGMLNYLHNELKNHVLFGNLNA